MNEKNAESKDSSIWRNLGSKEQHLQVDLFSAETPFFPLAIFSTILKTSSDQENPIPEELFGVLFDVLCNVYPPLVPLESKDPLLSRTVAMDAKIEFAAVLRLIAHMIDGPVSKKTFESVLTQITLLLDPACKNPACESNGKAVLNQNDWYKWLTPVLLRGLKRSDDEKHEVEHVHTQIDVLAKIRLKALAVALASRYRQDLSDSSFSDRDSETMFNTKLELNVLALPFFWSLFHESSSKQFLEMYMHVVLRMRKQSSLVPSLLLTTVARKADYFVNGLWGISRDTAVPCCFPVNLELFLNQSLSQVFFSKGFQFVHIKTFVLEDGSTLVACISLLDSLLCLLNSIQRVITSVEVKCKKDTWIRSRLRKRIEKFLPLVECAVLYGLRLSLISYDGAVSKQRRTPLSSSQQLDPFSQNPEEIVENLSKLLANFVQAGLRRGNVLDKRSTKGEKCELYMHQLQEIYQKAITDKSKLD
eukprot:TRINITY_DN61552_c1_g2_i1.p1 TRINITY_DN61552_c1_g2~~TRINITY_DN61552_c1_g2_i1.p1  ORF type:complete len:558 (-),score=130.98 TRINITY_DN61552_c1_g2_i1:22-1446(-)